MYPFELREQIKSLLEIPKWYLTLRKKQYKQLKEDVITFTSSFLPIESTTSERIYVIHNNMSSKPICKSCNLNLCNWNSDKFCYRKYCSNPKCKQNDLDVKNKRIQTNIERYGVTNLSHSDIHNKKRLKTNLERYGNEHPIKTDVIKQRVVDTNNKRYGVDYTCQNDNIKQKQKETNIERYGVDKPLKSKSIQEKIHQNIIAKYGVTSTSIIPEIKQKQKETNIERYGVDNPLKNLSVREKIHNTMLKKYGVKYALCEGDVREKRNKTMLDRYGVINTLDLPYFQQMISEKYYNKIKNQTLFQNILLFNSTKTVLFDESGGYKYIVIPYTDDSNELYECYELLTDQFPNHIILNQYDLQILHHDLKLTYIEISYILGVDSPTTIGRWMKLCNIQTQYFNTSIIHKEIVSFLSDYVVNIKINDRNIISPKELDIVLPDYRLAIEINGIYYHSEIGGNKNRSYHTEKLQQCNRCGYKLIQVTDNIWKEKKQIVKSRLLAKLNIFETKIFARKCKIDYINIEQEREFLNKTHIQGYHRSDICLGLFHNNILIAVMSFCKSRFNSQFDWELLRYSIDLNTSVIGGANKLFTYFINHYKPNNIISYSDKTWNTGQVYTRLNFEYSHTSKPNYQYIHTSDYSKLISRQSFQKHTLHKKLPIFDHQLSEWENMKNNGYDRYWDCGNDVWVWNKS